MQAKAAVTVHRPQDEVRRLWESAELRPQHIDANANVTFADAPGDRGTEIHVHLGKDSLVEKLVGSKELAKVKDDLRRFKQRVETGEIARSDATPEGESAERKFKQRPAQPLDEAVAR
jgi:uncharacterized membrane protein